MCCFRLLGKGGMERKGSSSQQMCIDNGQKQQVKPRNVRINYLDTFDDQI